MTYWCDTERHTAFCLIEAPNREAIQNMHNHAHGEFPHDIIEVDPHLVESFLGRIEDPQKGKNEDLNIIDDPAFRVIMVLETSDYLHRLDTHQLSMFTQKFHRSVAKSVNNFEGSIIRENDKSYLISFKSVTNAVLCALKIQDSFKYSYPKLERDNRRLQIGLCAGTPVTSKEGIFSESILLATQMCEIIQGQIVISSSVKSLYENENRNAVIDDQLIRTLTPQELSFVTQLVEFCEANWNKSNFNILTLSKELGYSKSQLYRKVKKLSGKSPITFIREYRLHKALELIHDQKGNISEIAFESGFNSPAYFSKSFLEKFGILPSKYAQMYQS